MVWTYKGVNVRWLGHDSFLLQGSKSVLIDPFKSKGDFKADLILISHEHSDHLSPDDIKRFSTATTKIVAPKVCQEGLKDFKQEKTFIAPGSKITIGEVVVEAVPAYNTNKFRSPGHVFHPKEDGRVGYVVTLDGVRFYHAGDTDVIPEMSSVNVDVAFLPVSGTYVMTADEAVEAAKLVKTKVAIPMHISRIVGSRADAERFKELLGSTMTVEILEQE
ncbi:MAG: MBL fold metallo-hydrolase [Thaumarchaeota archaeon]|nr:MBL fold metallo-hydrolase [Nitrososphaerota archaeon]